MQPQWLRPALVLLFSVATTTSLPLRHVLGDEPASWPAFLGAGASTPAVATELPLAWSPENNVAWKAPIAGYGQSSPVIWGDKVFVTSVEGAKKDTFLTTCFDLKSGQPLWQKPLENSSPVENSLYVSRAAPTPVVDSQRIISQFESGDCVAYTHDGEQLWSRSLGQDYGPFTPEFGLGASPCQTEEHLFVLLEHDGPSSLVALLKATGETAWKVERQPRTSWSSPAIVTAEAIPQVVVSSAGTVDGYDAHTGTALWTFNDIGGNTATTPIDQGNGRFLIAASAGRQGENAAVAKKSNGLMQIERDGDGWKVDRQWIAEDASPSWASPIVHDGLAYWINRVGVIYCYDATSGESVYTQRAESSSWATPVGVGDRIYFFGKEGVTTVIRAGKEFETLSVNKLWNPGDIAATPLSPADEADAQRRQGAAMFSGPTLYGVAIAGPSIVARIGSQLFCIRQAD